MSTLITFDNVVGCSLERAKTLINFKLLSLGITNYFFTVELYNFKNMKNSNLEKQKNQIILWIDKNNDVTKTPSLQYVPKTKKDEQDDEEEIHHYKEDDYEENETFYYEK